MEQKELETDSYYNTVVLASLTSSCSVPATQLRLEGHSIQYDKCGNVIRVDNRKICYYPSIYFFADGLDINSKKNSYTEDHLKLVPRGRILSHVDHCK